MADTSIKAIDRSSVHRITSGQVVVDLQTAVKELVENALDAGATNIEVRFKQYGLTSFEVIDNGSGIAPEDYESIALKHHTSKLSSFTDLTTITSFGFRGEALSSLCALSKEVTVTTARKQEEPVGANLEFAKTGKLQKRSKIARQRGTTVTITGLFQPLPVRRKELERNIKREFAKTLNLLTAYALVPCTKENHGVRLTVNNQVEGGRKTVQMQTDGSSSIRSAVTSLWGPKALNNTEDLDISFEVPPDKIAQQRLVALGEDLELSALNVRVRGLTSKFSVGCGRTGTDRQFFFVNGRPCSLAKVQKTFNEVYRTFSVNQSPFLIADIVLPTASCDVNVSPDKRTIFLHSEGQLLDALKTSLETTFAPARSTFDVGLTQGLLNSQRSPPSKDSTSNSPTPEVGKATNPLFIPEEDDVMEIENIPPISKPKTPSSISVTGPSNTISETEEEQIPPTAVPRIESVAPGAEYLPLPSSPNTTFGPSSILSSSTLVSKELPSAPEEDDSVVLGKRKVVRQTTLDDVVISTKGASWSQKDMDISTEETTQCAAPERALESIKSKSANTQGDKEPPRKKPRSSASSRDKTAKQMLRTRLTAFMREGTAAPACHAESSEEEDEEEEEEKEKEGEASDLQDVLGAQMDIDHPQPQNYKPKPIPQSEAIDLIMLDESETAQGQSEVEEKGPELIRIIEGGDISMRFDLTRITSLYQKQSKLPANLSETAPSREEEEVEALLRIIDKEDFATMQVVGQFNLGFIIARRKKGVEDDLFIVDQHAADEKYNFEDLQTTTRIQSQRLIRPQGLELTAADELLAQDNLQALKQNGFEIDVDEEAATGRKLRLVAQPISKNTVFDMKDLEELIHLMADRPAGQSGQVVRCSKARAMFASRACRKSIMVGKALNTKQMTTVIRHMGTMDQPWNCPHGRPTMRHLLDLNTVTNDSSLIDWTRFGLETDPDLLDLTLSDLCSPST